MENKDNNLIDVAHVLPYGKYKGQTTKEIAEKGAVTYLLWYIKDHLKKQPSPELDAIMWRNYYCGGWNTMKVTTSQKN